MVSESDSIAYGSINKPNSPSLQPQQLQEDHEETMLKDASFGNSLSRQNSLLSFTLNEIQHKSGKSFGSMNMDEFLANLWNVDEDQDQTDTNLQQQIKKDNNNGGGRQGSFSIPSPLCKKTVDEVWFEIQKDEPNDHHQEPNNHVGAHEPPLPALQPQRQQTLGEMTLEDFLVKAGIVQEEPKMQNSNNACFGMGQVMGMGLISPHQSIANTAGFALPYQIFPPCSNPVSNDAKNDQAPLDLLAAQQGKKRIIDGPLEVVVERRQRRMIKNRESAARSRARKQAYTVELEFELNQLKEENAKLKQLVEEIELNRKEEAIKKKPSKKSQKKTDKLRSIRRTVSLAW